MLSLAVVYFLRRTRCLCPVASYFQRLFADPVGQNDLACLAHRYEVLQCAKLAHDTVYTVADTFYSVYQLLQFSHPLTSSGEMQGANMAENRLPTLIQV